MAKTARKTLRQKPKPAGGGAKKRARTEVTLEEGAQLLPRRSKRRATVASATSPTASLTPPPATPTQAPPASPPSPASTDLTAVSDVERELQRAYVNAAAVTSAATQHSRARRVAPTKTITPAATDAVPYPEGFLFGINADLDEMAASMGEAGSALDRVLAHLGANVPPDGILDKAQAILHLVERGAGAA